nr:retrovirus-related Pol polyprotein from transposon TNT 1-94 [Tanacetum cinerariifolium]
TRVWWVTNGGGGSGGERRVRESGVEGWIDRVTSNLFGFAGKIPPKKFSGGGRVVAGGPDILFAVGLISSFMEKPMTKHLKILKRIFRYIKGTVDYGMFYSTHKDFNLVGYNDDNWDGSEDDERSTSRFIFFLGNNAFTWSLKKQHIVTSSNCEAEYVAAISCVCHAIWLRSMLKEIHIEQEDAIEIYVDNKSAIDLAKNLVYHDLSKHINTRYHFIRECIARNRSE